MVLSGHMAKIFIPKEKNLDHESHSESNSSLFQRILSRVALTYAEIYSSNTSSKNKTLTIFSRNKLERRKIKFNTNHTTLIDSKLKGDNYNVFFSLECGAEPKKLSSRFGEILYRVPLEMPVFQQFAWGTLDDVSLAGVPGGKNACARLPDLNFNEGYLFSYLWGNPRRGDYSRTRSFDDIFMIKDIVAAIALSILYKLRVVNELIYEKRSKSINGIDLDLDEKIDCESVRSGENTPVQTEVAKILSYKSAEEINSLIRVFHNPEIRVPVHFFQVNFKKYAKKNLDT